MAGYAALLLGLLVVLGSVTASGQDAVKPALGQPTSANMRGALSQDATAGSCAGATATSQQACTAGGGTWTAATGARGLGEISQTWNIGLGVLLGLVLVVSGFVLVMMLIRRGARGGGR